MSSRYFEFIGDSRGHASSKFWEITVAGASVTTRYGRIGAVGQRTIKEFEHSDAAERAAESLVREKTRKGYVEAMLPSEPSPGSGREAERSLTAAGETPQPQDVATPSGFEHVQNCPSCSSPYPSESARFCADCGEPRTPIPAPGALRRQTPGQGAVAEELDDVAAILRSLRPYRSAAFRLMVASSPNTPEDILGELGADPDPRISLAAQAPRVRSAPSLPVSWRWIGRKGADVANDPNASAATLATLARTKVGLAARAAIVQRLDCPPEALTALAVDCGYAAAPEPDSGLLMRLAVAGHPNTPAEAWPRLAAMELEPKAPVAVLEELARHPQRDVQLRIARHRGLQGSARHALITSTSPSVRRTAARHLYLSAEPSVISWAANLRPSEAWRSEHHDYSGTDPAWGLEVTVVAWHNRGRHEVIVALPRVPGLGINRCADTTDGKWRLRQEFRDAQSAVNAAQHIVENPLMVLRLGEPLGLIAAAAGTEFYDRRAGRRRSATRDEVRAAFAALAVHDALDGLKKASGRRATIDLASAQRAADMCRKGGLSDEQQDEVLATVRALPLTVGYWGPLKSILKSAPTTSIKAAALHRLESGAAGAADPGLQNLTWLTEALGRVPSRRTIAYLQRSACRELSDLATSQPDRFVELAGALLREQPQIHDYSRSPITFFVLYGRTVPGGNPYFQLRELDHPNWPEIQDQRQDLAPHVWDAHLDSVASIWDATESNSDVLTWAYRVLSDGGRAPSAWSDRQVIALIERGPSDLAVIATALAIEQPTAVRAMPWSTLTRLVSQPRLTLEQLSGLQGPIHDRLVHADAAERSTFLQECLFKDGSRLRLGGPLAVIGWGFLGQRATDEQFHEALAGTRPSDEHPLSDLLRAALVDRDAAGRLLQWASQSAGTRVWEEFWAGTWAPDPTTVDRALSHSPKALSVLWSCLGQSDPDPATLAAVVERMPHTIESLATIAADTGLKDLSEHQWAMLVALIGTDPDVMRRNTSLAVTLATDATGWMQAVALRTLEQSQLLAPVWLTLLESQSPPAAETALRFVDSIASADEQTGAVLAILDSGVHATRQDGVAALARLGDRLDMDRVYVGLAEHDEGDITSLVAARALSPGLPDDAALRAFDRRVLLKQEGSRTAKRQIQSRWMTTATDVERHSMIDQGVLLALIAHGDIEDQEWAFRMVAELAAHGAELVAGSVSATSDGAGAWST